MKRSLLLFVLMSTGSAMAASDHLCAQDNEVWNGEVCASAAEVTSAAVAAKSFSIANKLESQGTRRLSPKSNPGQGGSVYLGGSNMKNGDVLKIKSQLTSAELKLDFLKPSNQRHSPATKLAAGTDWKKGMPLPMLPPEELEMASVNSMELIAVAGTPKNPIEYVEHTSRSALRRASAARMVGKTSLTMAVAAGAYLGKSEVDRIVGQKMDSATFQPEAVTSAAANGYR